MRPRFKKRLNPNTLVLLRQVGIGVLVILGVGILIAAIWYGTRIQSLTISSVTARGGETIDASEVVALVEQKLGGTYLGIVPRRFAWLYPESEIIDAVEQRERIYGVVLERSDGTKLDVSYNEYVPSALWCDEAKRGDCLFLDTKGYAFAHAPDLSGGSLLRFVMVGRETSLDTYITKEDSLNNLVSLVELLAKEGWYISYVEIDQVGDAFLQVVGGGELKVMVDEAPKQTVENLLVVLASENFSHIKPGNFQYIDLRFGNKVFVNEELAVPEVETASEDAEPAVEEL